MEDNIVRTLYINVYQEERCFGGTEEGGWWYTSYTPLEFETAKCSCDLPISESPVQDEISWEYIGWKVELDTWVGHHKEDCPCVKVQGEKNLKWQDFKDEWYPQADWDESEPDRGESFKSGEISVSIELMKGSYRPEQVPMYS